MKSGYNLHLFITTAINETRLFKEAEDSLRSGRFECVEVLAVWEKGLAVSEIHRSGLRIHRVQTFLRRLQSRGWFGSLRPVRGLLMALGYFEYMIAAWARSWKMRPSHVSVHNPVLLPIGLVAARMTRGKLVYLPHELERERAGLGGMLKAGFGSIERAFIRRCDNVVTVSEPIADWYRREYGVSNIEVIRNVPQRRALADSAEIIPFRTRFGIPDQALVFIYQGLIDRARGSEELVEAFRGAKNHLVFMGYGDGVDALRSVGLPNVHYHPAVDVTEIVRYTAGADIGINVIGGVLPLSYALSLPNKFFEYLHAGLPVLVSDNLTYLASIVEKHDLGWCVPAETLRARIESIEPGDLPRLRANARRFADQNVWENEAQVFSRIYQ